MVQAPTASRSPGRRPPGSWSVEGLATFGVRSSDAAAIVGFHGPVSRSAPKCLWPVSLVLSTAEGTIDSAALSLRPFSVSGNGSRDGIDTGWLATLRAMWTELIVGLDLPPAGEILVAGEQISDVELPVGAGRRFDNGSLVLITRGDPISDDATALATGLDPDTLDLVILRDASGSLTRLDRVLLEAYRVLKPGGGILVTEFDAATLLDSRPQKYPQLLLSNLHPEVGDYLLRRHPRPMDIAMALVSAGFKDGDAYSLDYPLGHFRDFETYADFVAVEGWRGMDQISAEERQALLEQLPGLMKSVAPAGQFFDVEPISVSRAYKPV